MTKEWQEQIERYNRELFSLQSRRIAAAPQDAPSSPSGGDAACLRVRVYTAGGALPLAGASVIITKKTARGQRLEYALKTDRSGNTEAVSLPAVSRGESLSPSAAEPFSVYGITVSHDGYYRMHSDRVVLFGGVSSTQPAALIPLAEQSGRAATMPRQED